MAQASTNLQYGAGHKTESDQKWPNIYGGRTAITRLDIVIVGGGTGGLAAALCLAHAGHNVTVFEAERKLPDIAGGIQASPNLTRLLLRWGMGERLRTCGVEPELIVFHRYEDGEVVGRTRWGAPATEEFGAPSHGVHHEDLHRMLVERLCECTQVSFCLSARVKSIEPHPDEDGKVYIYLQNGNVVKADLLIGADGSRSLSRQIVCGRADLAQRTSDAVFMAVIPTSEMMKDKDLRLLVESPRVDVWMGPGKHVVGWCISAKKEYSLTLLQQDFNRTQLRNAEDNLRSLREDFAAFEEQVTKLLGLVDQTIFWHPDERDPLTSWVHSSGRLVLLGDACHPMPPYRPQGIAMAIEDAAVLGNLLSRLGPQHCSAEHLGKLLNAYEFLRMARTTTIQEASVLTRYIMHLPDGPGQAARDASMRRAMHAEEAEEAVETNPPFPGSDKKSTGSGDGVPRSRNAKNANQYADQKMNQEQFGYDADMEVAKWWAAEGEDQLRQLLIKKKSSGNMKEEVEVGKGVKRGRTSRMGLTTAFDSGKDSEGKESNKGWPESSTLVSASSESNKSTGEKKSFWRRLLGIRKKEEEDDRIKLATAQLLRGNKLGQSTG